MALGQEELAKLIIRFIGDTSELRKEVEKGKSQISGFASSIKKILAGIGFAIIVKKMVDLTRESINLMDTMSKTAQKVGETTESLSALAYAADLSGVNLQGLTTGLRLLSKNMYDAKNGTGEAKDAFEDLGIKVAESDGKLKSASEVLIEIAGKMETLDDDTKKAALAQRIFGRSGADLIPLLNQGAEGIKRMTDEAKEFGAVIDQQAAKNAEQFNDNIKRLQYSFRGLFIQLSVDILPTLIAITEAIIELRKNSEGLEIGISGLSITLKSLASAAIGVATAFMTIGKAWGAIAAIQVSIFTGQLKEAAEIAKLAAKDINAMWLRMGDAINTIWNPLKTVREEIKKTGKAIKDDLGGGAEDGAEGIDTLKKALEALSDKTRNLRIETIGLVDPLRAATEELDNWIDKTVEGVEANEEIRLKIEELKKAFWDLQEIKAREERFEAFKGLEDTKYAENMKTEMAKLQSQYRNNKITAQDYYTNVMALQKEAYEKEAQAIKDSIALKKEEFTNLEEEKLLKGESIDYAARKAQIETEWSKLEEDLVEKRGEWTRREIALMDMKAEAIRNFKLEQIEATQAVLSDLGSLAMGIYDLTGGRMKAFFYLARAIQFAQAVMYAYSSYTKTIGQMGFLGIPQANIVLSLGLAKAALIAAQTITGMAKGGPIRGGSGQRDDVPIMAMGGEYMLDKPTVRYYGAGVMEALRRHLIPREMFSGYGGLKPLYAYGMAQTGGMIAGGMTRNVTVNVPVSVEDTRLGFRLRQGIEKTVISILRDYSK